MKRAQRIMVVGAGGFIGRHVLAKLAISEASLVALDVFQPHDFDRHIEWIVGSANDDALLSAKASGCDTVVFLAASSLPASANADMALEISSHVAMVVRAAEICSRAGIKRFVFASSGGTVYCPASADLTESDQTCPLNAYGVSKLAIEHYLRVISSLTGMKTISLRVSNPFGPGQRADRGQGFIAAAMSAALNGDTLPCWGDGSTIRDFVYIDDVAAAFAKSCEYDGDADVFNIGSGIGRSLRDVIGDVEKATGRGLKVEYLTGRNIDVPRNVLDVTKASRTLGWQPLCSFERGLVRTAEWCAHEAAMQLRR